MGSPLSCCEQAQLPEAPVSRERFSVSAYESSMRKFDHDLKVIEPKENPNSLR
jgi:hypothetical protein